MEPDNLPEIILLCVGLVLGWVLSTGKTKRARGLGDAHDRITDIAESVARDEIEEARSAKLRTVEAASHADTKIKNADAQTLAQMVNDTFD